MSKFNPIVLTLILFFQVYLSKGQGNEQRTKDITIGTTENFNNLFKINDSLYRSEQPSKHGMLELQSLGILSVLNLRNNRSDKRKLGVTNLNGFHIPINTWKLSYADILESLRVIQTSKKPILVHCWHGSDRTGAVVAAYRMVYENWSKEAAITEFMNKKFGYHEKWFPGILTLLKSLDIDLLRNDLKSVK